jgi:methylenetetrahydrofolate dehydrogenase (NADP+)/methenyltetrahydrofolate cyclohydrolase
VDGNAIGKKILEKCRLRTSEEGISPHLTVVQVGSDPASGAYIKKQQQNCGKIGATFTHESLPEETEAAGLLAKIHALNADPSVSGIIVQLPLPDRIPREQVLEAIAREKDVDCFNPVNVGLVTQANPQFLPATPFAVLRILTYHGVATKGKHCVVVGKSDIVGKPIALLLANEFGLACTVSMVDKHTEDGLRRSLLATADILVVAAGVRHLIRDPSCLKPRCVVIDVGIHSVTLDSGKRTLQGDVDTKAVEGVCSLITPVPGGVGPVTSATLMENLVHAALLQKNQQAQEELVFRQPAVFQKRVTVADLLQGKDTLTGS